MKTYICIDIGGTSIKYGMIREKCRRKPRSTAARGL